MLLKLHFKALYRRVWFVISIVDLFGYQNRGILTATASITLKEFRNGYFARVKSVECG